MSQRSGGPPCTLAVGVPPKGCDVGAFFVDRRCPHPHDGFGLGHLEFRQLLILRSISVIESTGANGIRLGAGNPLVCEPHLLPNLLLVVDNPSERIRSDHFA